MSEEIPNEGNKPDVQYGRKLSLNFTDKDDKENAKFNDARLVDILRNYPLLYNKSLESYGDPDYTQWMWGEIANEMNEPHRKTTINLPFNWADCRDQWGVVKRALRYLSNPAAKSFRYPRHFRECLEFFQNYIKDRRDPHHTDRSQDLFISHTNLLEQLPFEKQLLLEKEVLDVILSNELEFCAPIVDPDAIEAQAQEEFGKVIGLLMPEVDVHTVHNELATETDPFIVENLIKEAEKSVVSASKQVIDVTDVIDISLKNSVSGFDLGTLLQIPSKPVEILVPQTHENIQYSVQTLISDGGAQEPVLQESSVQQIVLQESAVPQGASENYPQESDAIQDVIEEDIIEEDLVQQGTAFEIDRECVFQDDVMQEDLIEEVVSQGAGKDMPSLDGDGSFEAPANPIDFASVLNEMLE